MREYIKAKDEGRAGMMKLIEKVDAEILRDLKSKIVHISLTRQDPDVLLPGKSTYEEQVDWFMST